jgi:uncharacterized protein (TIGR02117 family)
MTPGMRDFARTGRGLAAVLLTLALAALTGCAVQNAGRDLSGADVVHVMSNGWHTDIVVPYSARLIEKVPELSNLPTSPFYAFGWGDADYYPARQPGLEAALRAALAPTPAVVHVTALHLPPGRFYKKAEVVGLKLPRGGMNRLIDYLAGSFDRRTGATALDAGPGLYPDSRFYNATGRFHLVNTCNTWTIKGLMAAGLPVGITRAIQAEDVMRELRPLAEGVPLESERGLAPYLRP